MKPIKLLSDQVDEREIAVILRELEKTRDVQGDIVEFGCYVGTTSVFLAHHAAAGKMVYLYDSFEGLPEKSAEDMSPVGEQFKTGELHVTKKQLLLNLRTAGARNVRVKKAWFSELAPNDIPHRISFAYLDGDYYHSVLDPLKLIWPKLAPSAVIVVDDYANEALPGAAKAVDDWLEIHPATLRVEQSLGIIRPR